MRVVSSAPMRIDLAGGTLDIWPLYLFHEDAQTVNVAISLRAHAEFVTIAGDAVTIHSVDTGRHLAVDHWRDLAGQTTLRLLARILHHFRLRGVSLTTRSESPAGAGIAGSSALNIAVTAGAARWAGRALDGDDLMALAMNLEAATIGVPTGAQDYRPAYHGGVAALELRAEGLRHVPLDVPPDELQARLVLAYTGEPRDSGTNNWDVFQRHVNGDPDVIECFERIRDAAIGLRQALIRGDWAGVARQIDIEWTHRKRLAPGVTTPRIDSLIARAQHAGALAAKVCGAGGGGCLACFADPARVPHVREALQDGGADVLDCRVEPQGLRLT